MNIKNLFLASLAALLMTACSNDDAETTTAGDSRVPILLSSAIEGSTRAGQSIQNDKFDVSTIVDVQIRSTDGETRYNLLQYQVTDELGTLVPVRKVYPYYPVNGSNVNIYALYPSGNTESSTFSVQEDQTKRDYYKASDLMRAGVSNQASQIAAVPLPFKHMLSKIQVNLTKNTNENLNDAVVRLLNVKKTIAFNASTGVLGEPEGNSVAIKMTNDGSEGSAAIVVPQTVPAGVLIEVALNNNDIVNYKTEQTLKFESGKVYTFNITVTEAGLTVSSTVSDWIDTDVTTERVKL